MPGSNCCLLTCIPVSQDTSEVVWYSTSLRIFHRLLWPTQSKPLAQSLKQKEMFFWNSLAFSMIQWMLAIWSLVPLPFLNPACTSGSSRFTHYWILTWSILSMTLLACEMSAIVWSFEHSLALPFFAMGMKTDLFQSCGHCWVFHICWYFEKCKSKLQWDITSHC